MTRTRIVRTLATALLAACLALAPLPALADPSPSSARPALRPTLKQLRSKGAAGIRALDIPDEEVACAITGTVAHEGGMYEDAGLYALAFMEIPELDSGWFPVTGAAVATDGTYALELPEGGDYRVGILDDAYVYGDAYYDGALTLESATSVPVSVDTTVAGIDVTVTPLPENIISGTVSFSGGDAPSGDIERDDFVSIGALQYDGEWEEWAPRSFGRVKADGTYRLHLPEAGSFRIAFHDFSGTFADVFYHDALTAEEATDVAVAAPADSKSGVDQTMTVIPSRRISGDDRYGTAAAASQFGFPDGSANSVVLATGENWPDAISGSVMATGRYGPLLLTRKASLPEVTADEIRRLQPFEVVIVGGYDAVSLDVEIALRIEFDIPLVYRLAGRDRYETAALVAEEVTRGYMGPFSAPGAQTMEESSPVVVASGEKFPDAMSAAPLAANAGAPVLLVRRDSIPPSVASFMTRHEEDFDAALVIGGPAAISTATASTFPGWSRVYGADRYGTAAAVARYGMAHYRMSGTAVGIASGTNFPDGLAAVPVLAQEGQPLLLTYPTLLSAPTEEFLADNGTSRALVFGGETAVGDGPFERILEVLGD